MFVTGRMITREQLDAALAMKPANKRIGEVLLDSGFITENQLVQTLGLQLGVPWVSLTHIDFPKQFASILSREVAERNCCVPIFVRTVRGKGDFLYVATPDPLNESGLAEVTAATRLPTRPMLATAGEVRAAIRVFYMDPAVEAAAAEAAQKERDRLDALAPTTLRESKKNAAGSSPQVSPPQPAGRNPLLAKTWIEGEPVTGPLTALPNDAMKPTQHKPEKIPSRASVPPPTQASREARQGEAPNASMMALTLLDGTQVSLPSRAKRKSESPSEPVETISLRDLVSALRATAHGADASDILGDTKWESLIAALLVVLVKKGVIQEREFMDEYKSV